MQSEPKQSTFKRLKSMFSKTRAAVFSPVRTDDAVVLEAASKRATDFLDQLDIVLARSKADQEQRALKQ